jgi:hypothetical protein
MASKKFDPLTMLRTCLAHGVEFIVVGGISAVLQGVAVTTADLDLVYAATPENIDRLLSALADLDAVYRDPGGRRIVPRASHLAAAGHNLLVTTAGALDLLGYVGTATAPRRYADLLAATIEIPLAGGEVRVRVIDLPTLIALKQEANREKDLAILPLLRAALEKRDHGASQD